MITMDLSTARLVGPHGTLPVADGDEITQRLAMLIEGECGELGPLQAARKYGFCKQRYFQLRQQYLQHGATALQGQKRGPKTNYRRTDEVVRQVIRHRFLDPDASAPVIAQKLRQHNTSISISSVERIIRAYGLQKKTLSTVQRALDRQFATHQAQGPEGVRRPQDHRAAGSPASGRQD